MKFSTAFSTLATVLFFASSVSGLAKDPYAACNGGNHYDVGHCCAFGNGHGPNTIGKCAFAAGVLVCDPSQCANGNCGCPSS